MGESKKSFLKRKSVGDKDSKRVNTTAKKSYRYYVDNFQKDSARAKPFDNLDTSDRLKGPRKLDFNPKPEDRNHDFAYDTNDS